MQPFEFGEYLRSCRKKKKLTVRQLDLYSGVSHSYISQIERGKRDIPSPEILMKLSKPLGVDYEELMEKAGYLTGMEKLYEAWANRKPTKQDQLDSIDRYIKEAGEKYGDNVEAERMKLVREIMEHIIELPEEDQRRISDFAARLKKV